MRFKYSRELKIGLVATICIATLAWGINFLKGRNVFSGTTTYYAVFPYTDGLVTTNDVLISGYKVGLVRDIRLQDGFTGNVVVSLMVENRFPIPKNSIAKLVSADLMGGKAIKLEVAPNDVYHSSGDTLFSQVETGFIDQLAYQMGPVKIQVEGLMDELQSVLSVINEVFNEENISHINQSISTLSFALQNIESSTHTINGMLADESGSLRQSIDNINAISSNIKENNQEISNIIRNVSAASDTLSAENLAGTLANIDNALVEFNGILTKLNQGEGSLGKLTTSDTLFTNLVSATKSLDLLLEDIKENPNRYINVSVFGGKRNR